MAEYILLIDSNYEEAEGFVRGLEEATASPWEVELYPNNKTYGLRRYLKFFTVALHVVTHPARYSGKTLLCWQQFYGIAIAFFCRLFHLKKRFRLVIMTFIYKPRSGFAGKLFERFVRYAVTSDAVDRILLTTRAEAPRYAETFGLPLSRFGFAHCGSIPHDPAAYDDPALKAQGYYFATGRSNRDYDFLIRAFRGRPETLCIACDVLAPCPEPNIQVEQNLFGEAMLRRMRNARAVLFAFENDQVASGQLMELFTQNPETIAAGQTALRIISIGFVISAVSTTASGALEGLGKGAESLVIALCRYVIFIMPLAALLCNWLGADGVWHAFWLTEVLAAAVSGIVYRRAVTHKK